ncbi:Ferredoxin-fold anticodon-binding domain-containing protein 1-like [Oopsacas minuta]|uniref:Ferredoxin-fold anticodon-binding domain-containing protein 1-like n=1 Tax=Oopsacas minuta TaxID=111878 RepID=A0AAV7K076_9METZ|nr:Ferredoxin-fold anticodon-binding domain-containing protein 1-like [Oopsacas minuta]
MYKTDYILIQMACYLESSRDSLCLILGDGDFSFTCDFLLHHHLEYSQIITSTLESREDILKKKKGKESIEQIDKYKNVTILFCLDATELHECESILGYKFNKVIFNFPHVGGKSNIGANRRLLKSFLQSSSLCLAEQGIIDVALCQGQGGTPGEIIQREYNNTWKVVEMAAESGLILSKLNSFSPSHYPNYTPTGYRSHDRRFHLERSLVHSFISHCDYTDPPLLHTLLQWKQLIPDCPYPLFEMEDLLIPFELRNRFKRSLWNIPKHPIQQISSVLIKLSDNHLSQCDIKLEDTHYCSPLLSATQLYELHLSPVLISTLYKCYKTSLHTDKYSELFLSPSLLLHIPSLIPSIHPHLPSMAILIGETYKRCGISHLLTEQPVSNQLMLLLTTSQSDTISMRAILQQILSHLIKELIPVWLPVSTLYTGILQDTTEIKFGEFVLASTSSLKGDREDELNREVGIVYLDVLATIVYNLDDVRVLWSYSSRVSSFFRNMLPLGEGTFKCTPPNLHPLRLQHDLCFWHPWERTIPEYEVATAIRCYCQEYVKSAILFNEFVCPIKRLSHNYRLVLQSCDLCLSRSKAHQLQSLARELLRDFYGVELR